MTANPFSNLAGQKFRVIMADPAWLHSAYSNKGHAKGALAQYPCMPLTEIKALPVGDLAAKDCWLWLWATNPHLRDAFEVIDAWGFTYSTKMTWVKVHASGALNYGTGKVLRGTDEPIILARRGNPKLYTKSTPTVFFAQTREHSRKPDVAYKIAESMFGQFGNKADLFARETRPGWASWGDESKKFDGGVL